MNALVRDPKKLQGNYGPSYLLGVGIGQSLMLNWSDFTQINFNQSIRTVDTDISSLSAADIIMPFYQKMLNNQNTISMVTMTTFFLFIQGI
jgi:hypothetical protein